MKGILKRLVSRVVQNDRLWKFLDKTVLRATRYEIEVIQSLDDIKKAQTYHFEELASYHLATRKWLLAEGRPAIMEWFWMRARK